MGTSLPPGSLGKQLPWRAGLVEKNGILWVYLRKAIFPPPPCRSRRGFFSDLLCENLTGLPATYLSPKPPWIFHSPSCLHWASSHLSATLWVLLQMDDRALVSVGVSAAALLLSKSPFSVSVCLASVGGRGFVPWPQFSNGFKKSCWFA